jgi:PmbA protein
MKNELYDLVAWSMKTAQSAGAGASRVRISRDRSVEISYRERRPETIKEASKKNVNIELFVDGRYSSQTTSDLRKESLKTFIGNAVAMTRLLEPDPFRTLPDPKYYQGRSEIDLGLEDPAYKSYSPEERHRIVKTIESSCLEAGGKKVVSVSADVQDGFSESVLMSSNGFEGYEIGTYYVTGAQMTAQDEGDRRPNGYYYVVSPKRKDLPAPEWIGKEAARETLALLGARKIKTETLPIIIRNQDVPRWMGGLMTALSGANIQQKRSFLADKKGQKIASEKLTLIDEPLLVGGLSSRRFDSDGMTTKKIVLVEDGVLKEFFINWYYSRKLKWEPTTGGASNLIIPPGTRSLETIMKDLGRGILITGFIGGNSNSTTGDSSIGIFGKLFENGVPVQSVSEMNIADNHLNFWHKLVEVANDPWIYSNWRTPSLVFKDVVVSGV